MSKIKKLSLEEAIKIAAGEVVERPANVVKELIENSIDALADQISIYIEQSGKKLINIIDNGCGMSQEDAQLCFEHHATSKITSVNDLENLTSFGFRGEALSSIAAVSKIKIITKDQESEYATFLELDSGKIKTKKSVQASIGTNIEVGDIFYNVPARKKFLKTDDTEWRQILNIFQAFVLSYRKIHFKLFHNGSLIYNCPTTQDFVNRVAQLWDLNLAQNIIDFSLNYEDLNISISGAISNHQIFRYNRNQIFIFVNNRWIRNQDLSKSILKGYANVLPAGKYPIAFLFISISSNLIDVNVHPRKEEVRFLNQKKINDLIQNIVRETLEKNLSNQIKKSNLNYQYDYVNFNSNNKEKSLDSNSITENSTPLKFGDNFVAAKKDLEFELENKLENDSEIEQDLEKKFFDFFDNDLIEEKIIQNKEQDKNEEVENVKNLVERDYRLIGQLNNSYILIEKVEGLFFIDQHAAHERILYELFEKKFEQISTIRLIFPNIININEKDLEIFIPYIDILIMHGIEVERFALDKLVVKSTPVYLKDIKLDELIYQLIGWIEENQNLEKNEFLKIINNKLRAQMACKAAIKAGDKLAEDQIYKLLDNLNQVDNRFTCPHGRPTGWLFSINEIERKFKRIK